MRHKTYNIDNVVFTISEEDALAFYEKYNNECTDLKKQQQPLERQALSHGNSPADQKAFLKYEYLKAMQMAASEYRYAYRHLANAIQKQASPKGKAKEEAYLEYYRAMLYCKKGARYQYVAETLRKGDIDLATRIAKTQFPSDETSNFGKALNQSLSKDTVKWIKQYVTDNSTILDPVQL